jgi:hypothetical protein
MLKYFILITAWCKILETFLPKNSRKTKKGENPRVGLNSEVFVT